jgi:hypothetical protein
LKNFVHQFLEPVGSAFCDSVDQSLASIARSLHQVFSHLAGNPGYRIACRCQCPLFHFCRRQEHRNGRTGGEAKNHQRQRLFPQEMAKTGLQRRLSLTGDL